MFPKPARDFSGSKHKNMRILLKSYGMVVTIFFIEGLAPILPA